MLRSKTGKARHIPMNGEVVSAMHVIEARPVRSEKVFLNEEGEALCGYKRRSNPAVKAAKIDGVTWYMLRHRFASKLVMAGVDLRTVAELMGHATIQLTMHYAHLVPEHKLDAVEKLVSTAANTDTNQVPQPQEPPQAVLVQ